LIRHAISVPTKFNYLPVSKYTIDRILLSKVNLIVYKKSLFRIFSMKYNSNNRTNTRCEKMNYLSIKDFAKKINVSPRWVNQMCINGQIQGAIRFNGKAWAIPPDAKLVREENKVRENRDKKKK
jgi:hypothetical protein